MKKFFKDNANKTAMQFAKEIISEVNAGVVDGAPMDSCSKAMHQAIMGVDGGSLANLVEDLVEDATGKRVSVTIASQEAWNNPYINYEVHCEWEITD